MSRETINHAAVIEAKFFANILPSTRIDQLFDRFDKRTRPPNLFENQVEQLASLMEQKKFERESAFVENPFFPGIMFKKGGRVKRIEEEKAEPWENIVDYLIRVYRIEQHPQYELATQSNTTEKTFRGTLRRLGIPLLHSSEYRDPKARATAAQWEDRQARAKRSTNIRKAWNDNRDQFIEKIHTPDSDASRSRSIAQIHAEEPEQLQRSLLAAARGKRKAQQDRMKEAG